MSPIATRRMTLSLGLLLPTFLTPGSNRAFGQLYLADPYSPYSRPYLAYAYPGAGYNPSLPNATRYPQGPAAAPSPNQFNRFADDLGFGGDLGFGRDFGMDGSSGRYRAYGRTGGSPTADASINERADAKFIADRERREQDLLRAMVERDPRKRDQMIREINSDTNKTRSDLGPSVRRGASTGSVASSTSPRRQPAAVGTRPGTARPASPSGGAGRTTGVGRLPAPPPISSRRSAGATPSPREVLDRSRRMSNSPRNSASTSGNAPSPPPR